MTVKRITPLILFLFILFLDPVVAQTKGMLPSVDSHSDSLAFLEMRSRMEAIRKERPTVALVLGGGGALGAAHIGVIKYLDESGIPVDLVVGTSIGGLIGGAYSLGYSGLQIDSIFRSVDWDVIMSDSIPANFYADGKRERTGKYCLSIPFHYEQKEWARRQSMGSGKPVREQNFISSISEGYLSGLNILSMFNSLAAGFHDDMCFLDLPTPFVCTATDLVSGSSKNWTEGSLSDAMRSTMSIPFAFMPVRKDDKVYVDGGVRNNFPVDIARALGADVVIGVDLHLPSTLEEASSAAQLVYMTATRPGADQVYENNIKDADIFIEPDMSKYNLLSFNEKAVPVLIERGYVAAKEKGELFEALVERTGCGGRRLSCPSSMDISNNPVKICSIEFVGLTDEEAEYFLPKLGLYPGDSYSSKDFERAVARVFGTGAFSKASYKLLGQSEPYRFELVCEKGPVNEFLIGLRADSEDLLSAALGYGICTNKLWGHKLLVSADLGKSSSLRLDWKYDFCRAPSLNAYLEASYSAFKVLDCKGPGDFDHYRGELWHNEAAFFISDGNIKNIDVDLGVKVENMPFVREFGGNLDLSGNWKSLWTSAFLKASFNSLDNKDFPSHGVKFSAGYDYMVRNNDAAAFDCTPSRNGRASMEFMLPLAFSGRFTAIPSLYARFIAGEDGTAACYYLNNVIGGPMQGMYFAHQLPFIGYNGVRRVGDNLGMAGLELRFKTARKSYVSVVGQMYDDCIGKDDLKKQSVYAAALQYSVKTMFGPITANIHWCSDIKRAGVYFSAGFDF